VRRVLALLLIGLSLCAASPAEERRPVPPLARVTDETGTLSAPQRQALESKLAAFEAEKGSQIAILMVPRTQPEDIAEFGIRVARAWQLGRKGINDGALIIVAKDEHRARIEVGSGLEGPVPDILARRIVDETMRPYFRADQYYRGLDAGLAQLTGLVNGEPLPPPARSARGGHGTQGSLFAVLVGALVLGSVLRALLGRVFGAVATGGIVGVAASLFAVSIFGALTAGAVAFFIALVGDFGARGIGGFGGGGFGGGGFGGGGFGGGGFSGGGGGFSGGGASGSW
jgi:uncharacterized protein